MVQTAGKLARGAFSRIPRKSRRGTIPCGFAVLIKWFPKSIFKNPGNHSVIVRQQLDPHHNLPHKRPFCQVFEKLLDPETRGQVVSGVRAEFEDRFGSGALAVIDRFAGVDFFRLERP